MTLDAKQTPPVETLLLQLEKTVRAVRMYPAGHGSISSFLATVQKQFDMLLSRESPLRLEVDDSSLSLNGETVYRSDDRAESLAFLLYKDGIRALTFYRGLESAEVLDLARGFVLEISSQSLEDDMATYLWERDLKHIAITVADDYLASYLPEDLRGEGALEERIREHTGGTGFDAADLKDKILTPPLGGTKLSSIPVKQTLLAPGMVHPTKNEHEHLRHLLGDDQWESDFRDLLDILFLLLRQEKDGDGGSAYLMLFRQILQDSLQKGPLSHGTEIFARIRKLESDSSGDSSRSNFAVQQLLNVLFTAELAGVLGESIEKESLPDIDSLPELLQLLPDSAIAPLTDLLTEVTSRKGRKTLCHALAGLVGRNLPLFTAGLDGKPWFVARNVAYTLGLVGSKEVIPHLEALLDSSEPKVRREALRALSRYPGGKVRKLLLRHLDDSDPGTRLQAIMGLPGHTNQELALNLRSVAASPSFAGRPFAEKEALYRKLGAIAPTEMIGSLGRSVTGGGWFRTRRRKEQLSLVVTALASHNSPEARALLHSLLKQCDGHTEAIIREYLSRPPRKDAHER